MKFLISFASAALFFMATNCDNKTSNQNSMEVTGIIEPIGMTTWQYGSHTISTEEEFYALKSEKIDLTKFDGKRVTMKGIKVEGYPVDNGPVFIDVQEIKE